MYCKLELGFELESKYGFIFTNKERKAALKRLKTPIPCSMSAITSNQICK